MAESTPLPPSPETGRLNIETHRRLINHKVRDYTGVEEYFDVQSGKRILTIPRQAKSAGLHDLLVSGRVPVYNKLAIDDQNVLLDVPSDARTIQSNLKFIARDVLHYKEIFEQVGEVLGRCAVSGLGLPDRRLGRAVLGGIAFSLNDADTFGGNVHLLPPYELNQRLTKTAELDLMREELLNSEYINPPTASELIRSTSAGWESVRS